MTSFSARASSMESDIEQAREDKASASDIEMAKDILKTLHTEVPLQQNGSKCCIYRVPNQLRNVNSKAYDPNLISIGPLHHENNGLEAMEKEKLKYFRKFTEQYGVDEKKMYAIVISIKNQEKSLRNCYSEKSILMESSNDFVRMILLDAVFIILFFVEMSNDDSDHKILEPWLTVDLREDLMLLENQLPLFIIQEIYDLVGPGSQDTEAIPFLHLATCHFIKESFLKRVETGPDIVEGSRHFTDLLRNLMLCKAKGQCDFKSTRLCAVDSKTHFTDLPRKLKTPFTDLLRKMMLGRANKQSETREVLPPSSPHIVCFPDYEVSPSPIRDIQKKKSEQSWQTETDSSSGVDWKTHFTDLLRKLKTHFTDLLRKLMLGRAIEQSEQSEPDYSTESDYSGRGFNESSSHSGPGFNESSSYSGIGFNDSSFDDEAPLPKKLSNIEARVLSTRVLKYSAVKLLKAGVRFEASKDKCLVKITFDKGVLKIPPLEVDHNFERRIRNIMAWEQCCYSSEAYICSYMKLIDHLIDSAEDVGLLVRKGIIVHRLGDDAAVSNMINNLCENIGYSYALFGDITRRLNDHHDNRCNHRKATLKLVYFPNIWRGTATVAAAILLILTFIQAVCSVKSVL